MYLHVFHDVVHFPHILGIFLLLVRVLNSVICLSNSYPLCLHINFSTSAINLLSVRLLFTQLEPYHFLKNCVSRK